METTHIWNEFSDSLKRFIVSRIKNKEIADDILPEVFIKIHLNIQTLKKQKSLKSWVFSITNNAINDYFKNNAKNKSTVLDYTEPKEEIDDEHSAKDCIIPLIKNLPPTYEKAVFLNEIEGLKQAEIAKRLNISLSGVKSRIQRGRNLLKQGFIDCCDYKLNELGHLTGEHKDKKDCKICNPKKQ